MKDKNVAAILALFMGAIGVHKFYLGRIGVGILYLLGAVTVVGIPFTALLALIDFFVLALMDNDEFNRRYNGSNMLPGAPVVVNMLPPAGGYPGYPPPGGYGYGPHQAPPPAGPTIRTADELKVHLEKLNELRISGLLTEEEFQAQKKKLLDTM